MRFFSVRSSAHPSFHVKRSQTPAPGTGAATPSLSSWAAVFLLSLLGLAAWLPSAAHAQILYGSITGNVTDATGAVVQGAVVNATDVGTNTTRQVRTGRDGAYAVQNLQPGTYQVVISAPSFTTAQFSGVLITPNTARRVDARLEPGTSSSTVSVTASGNVLQTDSATVNTVLSGRDITNLPTGAQRNYQTLNEILPGSSPNIQQHSGAGNPQNALTNHVNGLSWSNNVTLIDGASDIYPWLPETPAYIPPAESIDSVTIVTNSFTADEGMAGGYLTNLITRSGTNSLHGAAWEYNTDSAFQARNYFFSGRVPKNIINQFGLAVGGPILRNKLFFFVDWERTTQRQNASVFLTVPTDALRRGDFSGTTVAIYDPTTGDPTGKGRTPFSGNMIPQGQLSPQALKMIALLPEPNQPGLTTNNYFSSQTYASLRDNIDAKLTYTASDRTSFFARYSISPNSAYDPQVFGKGGGPALGGGTDGNGSGLIQLVTLGGTHAFSQNLVLNGYVGFTRQYLTAQDTDIGKNYGLDYLNIPGTNGTDPLSGGFPAFNVSGFTAFGDSDQYTPFLFRDNQYFGALNVVWSLGKHTLQAGGVADHYQINHFQPALSFGPRGGFSFSGGSTALNGGASPSLYNAWADFLLGLAHTNGKTIAFVNPATVRESNYGLYVEDLWQASHRLTLNYGLRYEIYPYAYGDHYGGVLYDPNTNNVLIGGKNGIPNNPGVDTGKGYLTPRFGLTYRINDATVLRSGFGISTNPDSFRMIVNSYPSNLAQTNTGLNSFVAAGTLASGIPAFSGLPDLNQGTLPLPKNVSTATYDPNFRRGYIYSYNFTLEHTFPARITAQVGYVGNHEIRMTCTVALNAAAPGTGAAGQPLYQKFGTTASIGQYTPFCPSNYNSLQTQAVRRIGSGTQIGVVYVYSKAFDFARSDQISFPFQYGPAINRNYALANFDQTHVFSAYGIYELPFGKNKMFLSHGVIASVVGGWKLAGVLSRTSGTPFTITASGASLNAPGNTQLADQVKKTVKILGGHGPNNPYFDPNAFAPVTTARFGTSSLDEVRGPGYFNLDATVSRTFTLYRNVRLEVSAQGLSVTNTPQFGNPGTNVSNATFSGGVVSNLNDYDIISSAGGNRQLQLGGKFIF